MEVVFRKCCKIGCERPAEFTVNGAPGVDTDPDPAALDSDARMVRDIDLGANRNTLCFRPDGTIVPMAEHFAES